MDTTASVIIVHAIDCKTGAHVSNTLQQRIGTQASVDIKPFKDLKKIEDIEQENIYIFVVSSYLSGKRCRSIRRFQRKLDKCSAELSTLLFCIIAVNDSQTESNKMYLSLKQKRKATEFHPSITYVENADLPMPMDALLLSLTKYAQIRSQSSLRQNKPKITDKKVVSNLSENEYDFTICYGTMTGNAKEICNEIVSIALSKNSQYSINGPMPLNELNTDTMAIKSESLLIIVISTTGDGAMPTNADRFYRKLKIKCLSQENKHKLNDGMSYAILGLGDSNYSQFNAAAKQIDKCLSFLSKNKFYHTGYADDGIGLEDVVEPWKYGVINEIQRKLNKIAPQTTVRLRQTPKTVFTYESNDNDKYYNHTNVIYNFRILQKRNPKDKPLCRALSRYELFSQKKRSVFKAYDCNNQFRVALSSCAYETAFMDSNYSETVVIRLTFSLPKGYAYDIGDVLCVFPPNPTHMVDSLLNRLKFSGNDVIFINTISETMTHIPFNLQHIPFKKEMTVYDVFTFCIDISHIPKSKLFFQTLATFCSNSKDRKKLQTIKSVKCTLLQLLQEFESCYPSLQCLLYFLSELKCRQYSICSAPNCSVDEIDICFRVFTDGGICSNWLYSLCVNCLSLKAALPSTQYVRDTIGNIYVYLKLSPSFKPPTNKRSNLILIGPGTGVAVFRAFLQDRHTNTQYSNTQTDICNGSWRGIEMLFSDEVKQEGTVERQGQCLLFFGCRHPRKDYLFEADWKQFEKDGVLTKLFVAFSRCYDNKVYVQHLLKEESALISNLILNENAFVFVCGDASKMAKDVEDTMIEIVALHSKMSLIESTKYIQTMKASQRYNIDVWNSITH